MLSYRQLSFTVFSGRATIGHVQLKLSALKQMEQDDMGYRTQIFPIFLDGLKRGTMKLRLILTELKDDRSTTTRDDRSNKSTAISIPFVVRINRVAAVDIDPKMKQQFFGRNALALVISYDKWSKATLNCTVSNQKEWAEWVDDDWIFIVTNANSLFELFIMDGDHSVGSLSMNVRDILNTPRGKDGSTDLVAFMYRGGGEYTIAKIRVLLTVAPYISPEEQKTLSNRMQSNHYQPQPSPIIGYLRIKHLHAFNLVQVLGLFRNSPRITITFGDWSASTNVALDAGSEYIWDNLDWGRIPMQESALFVAKVTSGNEVIGRFRLTTTDFISVLPKDQSTIIIEGKLVSV